MAKKDAEKIQRQRLQAYTAHQTVHQRQVERRRRDQFVAAGVMVVAVAAASLGYWAWSPAAEADPTETEVVIE